MKGSSVAMGVVAAIFLASFFGTVLAQPYYIKGYVCFTEPNGDSVPCCSTFLYSDPSCQPPYFLGRTETDLHGGFEFYGDFPDTTWVKIVFDADRFCEACSANGYKGSCTDTSFVTRYVTQETGILHLNLDQSGCSCPDP